MRRLMPVLFVAGALVYGGAAEEPVGVRDTCVLVSAENIVKGEGNWFVYLTFSDKVYTIQAGDRRGTRFSHLWHWSSDAG